MNFDDYQKKALEKDNKELTAFEHMTTKTLGLCGESGEVAELIKKHIGYRQDLNKDHLKKELGDILWYISTLASHSGLSLKEIAQENLRKLDKRYPKGFDSERAINKGEEK